MKKKQRNRLVGSVFEFSGDYVIAVIDILDISKYLILKKIDNIKLLGLFKNVFFTETTFLK